MISTDPIYVTAFQPSSDHSFSEEYVESKRAGRNLVSIVLGLNVKEAATLGMIDRSLLSERDSSLAPTGQMALDNDDSLFVSEDDNEVSPTGIFQPSEGPTGATREQPPTSGSASAFGSISEPTAASAQNPASGLSFPKPNESQLPAAPNPFGSLFGVKSSEETAPSPSLNPFAKPFSPFSSSQGTESSQPTVTPPKPASPAQPSSLFSNTGTFAQTSQSEKAPVTSAASPFSFPSGTQPPASQTSLSNPFQNVQKPTTSNTPPFGAPSLFDVNPDQPNSSTAGQSSTSIFDTAKPTPPPEASTPLFSFSKPMQPATQEPQTSTPQISPPQPPAQPAQPTTPFSLSSDTEEEKQGMQFLSFKGPHLLMVS